jgi:hypothetical protein
MRKVNWLGITTIVAILTVAAFHDSELAAQGAEPVYERVTFGLLAHPGGHFVPAADFGGYPWRTGTPSRADSLEAMQWPMVAQYGPKKFQTLYYYGGRFRSANGSVQAAPVRWFYLRLDPEVWDDQLGVWKLPGLDSGSSTGLPATPVVGDKKLRDMLVALMSNYPANTIKDVMDTITAVPSTGAPL